MTARQYAITCILLSAGLAIHAQEPILPLPATTEIDKTKAELGKFLFFDPNLSKDKTVSCASCHDPANGGADPRIVSIGIEGRKGSVNAPTVFNAYFNFRQFWNGRAENLEEQAQGPLHNPAEMGMDKNAVVAYLSDTPEYLNLYQKAYRSRNVRYENIIDAIAEFEKALITPNSKFDRFLRRETKLDPEERAGYRLFKTLGCITCHNGINIGGNSYQKLGTIIPYDWEYNLSDRYYVTGREEDKNVFKVPTLRNIVNTAPYFHDGSATSLDTALQTMAYHNLGLKLSTKEQKLLSRFLHTLTGETPAILSE